ncbi:YfiT family bacillithiol transferase [Paenibacillus beijingensis]|uniref:Putative metal-dependent hydrolase VN24_21690 n=1 Tax=Paenibacillus beijingensis TaxID=1126833 RepID=A0A0D5NP76_9BACL|nr:bacillithiol transferase BstA [Paenibacillus beijingensis]AJY76703.1 hypothetical protein VN24_21690 [Paenibacillus beijingensis]
MDQLRFPIGHYEPARHLSNELKEQWITDIETLPMKLLEALDGLSEEQLNTPYREGGWTVRQVVHHMADSHMNSFTRFKLALTEDNPVIKPYYEDRWAELDDTVKAPIAISLRLLESLHARWGILLRSLSTADFARTFVHPQSGETNSLEYYLGMYSWHGRHHMAHITSLRRRKGWI